MFDKVEKLLFVLISSMIIIIGSLNIYSSIYSIRLSKEVVELIQKCQSKLPHDKSCKLIAVEG